MNKHIIFPYYSGNIKFTKVIGHVNLYQFIEAHRNPKNSTLQIIKEIKAANEAGNKQLKRQLKHKLYSFTPSVFIQTGLKRIYENVESYTGLLQMDFDNINDIKISKELKEYIFEQPEIITVYNSPSGAIKAIMNIKKPKDKQQYKAIHKSVTKKYEETGYFDVATKNPMLPLFLSVDKNILYRDVSECAIWVDEDNEVVKYNMLNERQQPPNFTNTEYYFDKTVKIFEKKLYGINDNGHIQLRSACLILGSRAAAGYINLNDACSLAENLIKSNQYLSKGTDGYLKTASWAISEGYKTPLYYD